ncbi:MAG TPA: radical SAM protein [Candidatus Methanoperedenaceae archaeon]|nr:radical SAM protein [Candidatus Methanoperedenaceae archaeon]
MFTELLFPPQWIPTQPYLSLPALTAYLLANDCEVGQTDLNVTFFDDLLSRRTLSDFLDRARKRFKELESGSSLPAEKQKEYAALGTSMLFGEYILDEVDGAKQVVRDKKGFYDIEKLFGAFRVLELGLRLASSAYFSTSLTFHAYDMRHSCRSSKSVMLAINDREENLFIDYFEKKIPSILEKKPELVGISIINTSQLIPGLTLASLIKKADSSIHINVGGSVFTRLISEISGNHDLFSVFDSVIVHEGETPLLGLVNHLEQGSPIEEVPNLIYRDGDSLKVNSISPQGEDVNALPTPCFDGLPLGLYFSPHLVIPVLSSRGCYWRRCTFCDHGYGYSGRYRPRDADRLLDDLRLLKEKYGTSFFTFQDEGVSPALMNALSDRLLANKLGISWLADSRFEPAMDARLTRKLAAAGCSMLYFGLESANERVLGCMDKGIRKAIVPGITRACTDAGIWTHLFLIFGFPTETLAEARETMEFILSNKRSVRSMSYGSFQLTRHSKVYEDPQKFGVGKVNREGDIDLSLWYDYEVSGGMSKRDIERVLAEFDSALSKSYADFQIWSNLDREHLFLYISHYKAGQSVPDLSRLLARVYAKQKRQNRKPDRGKPGLDKKSSGIFPVLRDGVFLGTFNFNLANIIHGEMARASQVGDLQKGRTNVLFDTAANRVFTVSDLAKDMLDKSSGGSSLSDITGFISTKYGLPGDEAEKKCRALLTGLIDRNVIDA